MARLAHPNVVTVHDVGVIGDQVFVAMELVDGGTLREWLATPPRTLARGRSRSSSTPGAGSPPRTPPGSSTATSSRRTCSSASDGRVRVTDFGLAALGADRASRRPPLDAAPTARHHDRR